MKLGCCVWTAVSWAIRFLGKAIDAIVEIALYFGLYIPIFYAVFGGILMMFTDFTMKGSSAERTLFIVGLVMSAACSVAVTIRNLIVKPISKALDEAEEKRREKEAKQRYKERKRLRQQGYYRRERAPERPREVNVPIYRGDEPRIYRSARNPRLIIYEYADRFEIFEERGDKLVRIDIKGK